MQVLMTLEELQEEKTKTVAKEYTTLKKLIDSNGTIPVQFPDQEVETDDVYVLKKIVAMIEKTKVTSTEETGE